MGIGFNGTGTLNVRNGGSLDVGASTKNALIVAANSGSTGTINLTGSNSTIRAFEFAMSGQQVGGTTGGNSFLNVQNGSFFQVLDFANIGQNGPGVATAVVDGTNSQFLLSGVAGGPNG